MSNGSRTQHITGESTNHLKIDSSTDFVRLAFHMTGHYYLALRRDVAETVWQGAFVSDLQHYLRHGCGEGGVWTEHWRFAPFFVEHYTILTRVGEWWWRCVDEFGVTAVELRELFAVRSVGMAGRRRKENAGRVAV